MYLQYVSVFLHVPMYLCTCIRLLIEKAIMIPPQISREGQGGGKEGFRPSGYSGLNQEHFKSRICPKSQKAPVSGRRRHPIKKFHS